MTALDLPVRPAPWRLPAPVRAVVAWLGSLRHLSLLAVLPITSWAHWELAVLIGTPPWLAWCWPLALDAYVLAALRAWEVAPERRHRDLAWALALDLAAVPGSHAMSLMHEVTPRWALAVVSAVVGCVQVLVLWRVHALDVATRRGVAPRAKAAPPVAPVVAVAPVARAVAAPAKAAPRGDVVAELQRRRAAGEDRGAATRGAKVACGVSLRTAQRAAARVADGGQW